ncbi:MAG: TonB family protein [Steroidobacteraceae bacterium]
MTATYAARGARQSVVLTAILGLHFGLFVLVSSGLGPRIMIALEREPPPIQVTFEKEEPTVVVAPDRNEPAGDYFVHVVEPVSNIPVFPEPDAAPTARADPELPAVGSGAEKSAGAEYLPPALRTRDRRLAALIDSCYPAASRRLGEEGRAVARITIGADGKARAWRVAETSGFSRLDEAMGCVIEQIIFVAGRQDGRAVEADALLPIVFQLN